MNEERDPWTALRVDKASPIPAYYQLKEFIKGLIEEGKLKADSQLPAERELSLKYDVSRMTVRQALTELVKEGYLYREKGKGTFVSPPKLTQPMLTLVSFSENMHQRGMVARGKTLKRDILYDGHIEIKDFLDVGRDAALLEVERLRFANGVPMVLERSYFDFGKYGFLMEADLENSSLYHLLEQHSGNIPTDSRETVEAGLADEVLSKCLKIEKGSPILMITAVSYGQNHQPIEYVQSFYRGDRFKLYVEMKKEDR